MFTNTKKRVKSLLAQRGRSRRDPPAANEAERKRRYSWNVVGTLLFSIFVPVVTNVVYPSKLTGSEQVVIGLTISILLLLIHHSYLLNEELHWIRSERTTWQAKNETEDKLVQLRDYLEQLTNRGHTLFHDIVDRELAALARRAESGLHGGVFHLLRTDDDATNLMLRPYDDPTDDTLRMVHFIGDNDFLYDTHARDYFRDVYTRVQSGHIRAVRRLIIYEDATQLKLYRTKLLASFHYHAPGYDYKMLPLRDYKRILGALANMPELPRDFGIYGSRFSYRSTGASASEAIGVLACSDQEVERLTTLFDRSWDSMSAHRLESHFPTSSADTLEALFKGARLAEATPTVGWIRAK